MSHEPAACCPHYHQAVELIGKRWTGAIVVVLLDGPLRFSQIGAAVPQLSDRLLSERMKELEAWGLVERRVVPGPPTRVEYTLTEMGRDLEAALSELKAWGRRWLAGRDRAPASR
ncbi:MAG TPA: helix-turn-helix domain-containing protein [Solirubrobacteraceae bacterium]|nr:helix-turn-helix domain-containing protein [Solirubrobacteraceae bacterium]